jgi:hypothetical protein
MNTLTFRNELHMRTFSGYLAFHETHLGAVFICISDGINPEEMTLWATPDYAERDSLAIQVCNAQGPIVDVTERVLWTGDLAADLSMYARIVAPYLAANALIEYHAKGAL